MSNLISYQVLQKFVDKYTNKYYDAGSSFQSDEPERLLELHEKGFILIEDPIEFKTDKVNNVLTNEEPNHVGGGYYELPNGEKIRGKEKALERLNEIEQSPPKE